jgi:prevent-host-death family protein
MSREITTSKLRKDLGDVLNQVYYASASFTIKRNGKVVAIIMPVDNYKEPTLEELAEATLKDTVTLRAPKVNKEWINEYK